MGNIKCDFSLLLQQYFKITNLQNLKLLPHKLGIMSKFGTIIL